MPCPTSENKYLRGFDLKTAFDLIVSNAFPLPRRAQSAKHAGQDGRRYQPCGASTILAGAALALASSPRCATWTLKLAHDYGLSEACGPAGRLPPRPRTSGKGGVINWSRRLGERHKSSCSMNDTPFQPLKSRAKKIRSPLLQGSIPASKTHNSPERPPAPCCRGWRTCRAASEGRLHL